MDGIERNEGEKSFKNDINQRFTENSTFIADVLKRKSKTILTR